MPHAADQGRAAVDPFGLGAAVAIEAVFKASATLIREDRHAVLDPLAREEGFVPDQMQRPPSTSSATPVMNSASSEAR